MRRGDDDEEDYDDDNDEDEGYGRAVCAIANHSFWSLTSGAWSPWKGSGAEDAQPEAARR